MRALTTQTLCKHPGQEPTQHVVDLSLLMADAQSVSIANSTTMLWCAKIQAQLAASGLKISAGSYHFHTSFVSQ